MTFCRNRTHAGCRGPGQEVIFYRTWQGQADVRVFGGNFATLLSGKVAKQQTRGQVSDSIYTLMICAE